MGLFGFPRKQPTDFWPPAMRFDPVLDLRDFSLCGIPLGAAVEQLQHLGKPDNASPLKKGRFVYCHSGTTVEIEEGKVAYFAACLEYDASEGVGATSVTVINCKGERGRFWSPASRAQVQKLLGDPTSTDTDETAIADFHRYKGHVLEVESSPDGIVRRVNLYPKEPPQARARMMPYDYLRDMPVKERPQSLAYYGLGARYFRDWSKLRWFLLACSPYLACAMRNGFFLSRWIFAGIIILFGGALSYLLFISAFSGMTSSNWGTYFRDSEPVRYWLDMALIGLFYVGFLVAMWMK
jgi:hypothetical protein